MGHSTEFSPHFVAEGLASGGKLQHAMFPVDLGAQGLHAETAPLQISASPSSHAMDPVGRVCFRGLCFERTPRSRAGFNKCTFAEPGPLSSMPRTRSL